MSKDNSRVTPTFIPAPAPPAEEACLRAMLPSPPPGLWSSLGMAETTLPEAELQHWRNMATWIYTTNWHFLCNTILKQA